MPTHLKRTRLRPGRTLGRVKIIPRDRARDEVLRFFLRMSKLSIEAVGAYINGLLRTA
jgi:hypothetical protein